MKEEEDYGDFESELAEFAKGVDSIMSSRDDDDDGDMGGYTDEQIDDIAKKVIYVMSTISDAISESGGGEKLVDLGGRFILSDIVEKDISQKLSNDVPFTPEDIKLLMYIYGAGDTGIDMTGDGDWDDGMIGKYAEHLKNYLYTYKDEARKIDPTIDPNEEHVGPMAQDIEKVAPDCVKETPEGVKTVDGDRLALVNAGVIGDLSREVIELRSRLAALEAKL